MKRGWWWKWPLTGMGILAVAGLLVTGVGATLPVSHTAFGEVEVPASPDAVWALITGVERFPEWRPGVHAVQRLEDRGGMPAWREESATGPLTLAVEAWEPPRRLVTRIADEGLPFGGTWTFEVWPEPEGARLRIREDGDVYNPFFRFMARFVFGHEGTIRDYLSGVSAELGGA